MQGSGSRTERIADHIKDHVSQLLSFEVKDPAVGLLTVTHVKLTGDMGLAHVYYTLVGDEVERAKTARALDRATAFVRRRLAEDMNMRRAPDVRFHYDENVERQERVETLLQEIATERAEREKRERRAPRPRQMTTLSETAVSVPRALIDVLRADGPVILCGHARPDGDSIGSVMAMAAALRLRGRQVRTLCSDPAPSAFLAFPRMDTLEIVHEVDASGATVVVMESGALTRTGIAGLERAATIVNIDHHLGNTGYGTVNWFDEGAAACVELVADAIDAIDVAWTSEIATYLYLGLNTDTGSFRHSHITARSFELARRCVLAGADPGAHRPDGLRQLQSRTRAPDRRTAARHAAGGRGPARGAHADARRACPRWLVAGRDRGHHQPSLHGAGHPRRVPAAQRRSWRDPRQPALEGDASIFARWRNALAAAGT